MKLGLLHAARVLLFAIVLLFIAGGIAAGIAAGIGTGITAGISCKQVESSGLPRIRITVGGTEAFVEVAASGAQRQHGLMNRGALRANEGMLFIFPRTMPLSFWMKHTLIPLDLGYFDEYGRLIEFHTMKPQPGVPDHKLKTYLSSRPARYALEMNAGWFRRNKLRRNAILKLSRRIQAFE